MKEETALERWDRGKTLLLESLYKPDSKLRGCAFIFPLKLGSAGADIP